MACQLVCPRGPLGSKEQLLLLQGGRLGAKEHFRKTRSAGDIQGTHPKGGLPYSTSGALCMESRSWGVAHPVSKLQSNGVDVSWIRPRPFRLFSSRLDRVKSEMGSSYMKPPQPLSPEDCVYSRGPPERLWMTRLPCPRPPAVSKIGSGIPGARIQLQTNESSLRRCQPSPGPSGAGHCPCP